MNLLDLSIVLILAYNVFIGFRSGAVRMIGSLISVFVTFYVTKHLFDSAKPFLDNFVPVSEPYSVVHFGLLFVLVFIAFQILVYLIHQGFKLSGIGFINHGFGIGIGFLRGILFCVIIVTPLSIAEAQIYSQSKLLTQFDPLLNRFILQIHENENLRVFLQDFDLDTKKIANKALKQKRQAQKEKAHKNPR